MKKIGGGWQSGKFSQIPLAHIAGIVWLSGSLFLLCVQVFSERRFRRRLAECREEITVCGQKAYKARGISTPLLFRSSGFSLDIYIPEEIVEKEELVAHAMLHENAHKRHGDIWWGYLRNLLLAAYWFHPLVWVAAVCSKRDCEYACDSSVTRQMNRGERIAYGNSLLSLVELGGKGSPFHTATLMSIKKSELKKRIRLVKRGKRKGVVTTALATVLIAAVILATFTGAKAETDSQMETRQQEKLSETEPQSQEKVSETGIQRQEKTGEEPTEPAISAEPEKTSVQRMRALEVESSKLTMEKVIDSYNKKELFDWTIKDILKYKNISEIPQAVKGVRDFKAKLPYQGTDYQVEICFDYGKIYDFFLQNMETGECRSICYEEERLHDGWEWDVLLADFFHHDKVLDEQISYTLPEKLLETKDSYNIGRIGRLFCRDEKEKYGRYGSLLGQLWNSTGGLMRVRLSCREGALDLFLLSNHGKSDSSDRRTALGSDVREFRGGKLQRIDGCENMTSLQGLVYTEDAVSPESIIWYNQKEARKLTEREMKETLSRKLWIVCVMDGKNLGKEHPAGYVFFFDAERYTKKQMIALAKSVHLK